MKEFSYTEQEISNLFVELETKGFIDLRNSSESNEVIVKITNIDNSVKAMGRVKKTLPDIQKWIQSNIDSDLSLIDWNKLRISDTAIEFQINNKNQLIYKI